MITFNLEVGGSIAIHSMDAEESGKLEIKGVFTFLKNMILNGTGVHGVGAVQEINGIGKECIPNDMRFVLNDLDIGYVENKTKGFVESDPDPIPADYVR